MIESTDILKEQHFTKPPARYTEARLSKLAEAGMLTGLKKNCVEFVPNYDESTTEPTMLSGIFPNLLCNGTEGIAVGVSCSLIPHNLCWLMWG